MEEVSSGEEFNRRPRGVGARAKTRILKKTKTENTRHQKRKKKAIVLPLFSDSDSDADLQVNSKIEKTRAHDLTGDKSSSDMDEEEFESRFRPVQLRCRSDRQEPESQASDVSEASSRLFVKKPVPSRQRNDFSTLVIDDSVAKNCASASTDSEPIRASCERKRSREPGGDHWHHAKRRVSKSGKLNARISTTTDGAGKNHTYTLFSLSGEDNGQTTTSDEELMIMCNEGGLESLGDNTSINHGARAASAPVCDVASAKFGSTSLKGLERRKQPRFFPVLGTSDAAQAKKSHTSTASLSSHSSDMSTLSNDSSVRIIEDMPADTPEPRALRANYSVLSLDTSADTPEPRALRANYSVLNLDTSAETPEHRSQRTRRRVSSDDVVFMGAEFAGSDVAGASSGGSGPEQVESDEAMARRLQEEMDRELAEHICRNPQTPNMNRHLPGREYRTGGRHDAQILAKISRLTEYEWRVHQAILRGQDVPSTPRNMRHRDLTQILDSEILHFMERHPEVTFDSCRELNSRERPTLPRGLEMPADRAGPYGAPFMRSLQFHPGVATADSVVPDFFSLEGEPATRRRTTRRGTGARRRHVPESVLGRIQAIVASPSAMGYEQLLELGESIGDVNKGLTQTQIHRLPTKIFKASENLNSSTKPAECSVCFCEYEDGEELRLLPCFHDFHTHCIDKWIKGNATCPVCRVKVKVD